MNLLKIARFVKENYPYWNEYAVMEIVDYLIWFKERDLLLVRQDNHGGVRSVLTFHICDNQYELACGAASQTSGRIAYADLFVSHHFGDVLDFMMEVEMRYGQKEFVVWDRGERTLGKTPRIYNWNKTKLKLTERLNYGKS